jgi:hypothetical protein
MIEYEYVIADNNFITQSYGRSIMRQIRPLLPTYFVSCVARFCSYWQKTFKGSWMRGKTVAELTSNLIKKKLKERTVAVI